MNARAWSFGRRSATVAGLAIVALFAGPAPAFADLKLCNITTSRVGVAVGYRDGERWIAEGWWNILANSCETIFIGELKSRYYYVHAVDYDRGGEWAGTSMMCTNPKAFTIEGVQDCEGRGYQATGFFEVDTGDETDWTIRLTDPEGDRAPAAASAIQ